MPSSAARWECTYDAVACALNKHELLEYSITSSGEAEGVFVLHDATKQGLQADWRLETTPPAHWAALGKRNLLS